MEKQKTILLAGASGLVGKKLIDSLQKAGYRLILLSRNSQHSKMLFPDIATHLSWDDIDAITGALETSYAVINLSGAPIVGKRWSKKYKEELYRSRITTTQVLVDAIAKAHHHPAVVITASAVGFYGIRSGEQPATEESPAGDDFLAKLCLAWEKEANKAKDYGCRVVCIRSGIILDKNEGALPRMVPPFRLGFGGPIGLSTFYFPWIHIEDEVQIILFALAHASVDGPINATAPDMVTNKDFANILGRVLRRPSWLPIPGWILYLLFGEGAHVISSGIPVLSKKITQLGFTFTYPHLQQALQNILA